MMISAINTSTSENPRIVAGSVAGVFLIRIANSVALCAGAICLKCSGTSARGIDQVEIPDHDRTSKRGNNDASRGRTAAGRNLVTSFVANHCSLERLAHAHIAAAKAVRSKAEVRRSWIREDVHRFMNGRVSPQDVFFCGVALNIAVLVDEDDPSAVEGGAVTVCSCGHRRCAR